MAFSFFLQGEYINRKKKMSKKMMEGESWLLPSTVPAEREEDSEHDRQERRGHQQGVLDVERGEFVSFYRVCRNISLPIAQLPFFTILLSNYFIFQTLWCQGGAAGWNCSLRSMTKSLQSLSSLSPVAKEKQAGVKQGGEGTVHECHSHRQASPLFVTTGAFRLVWSGS